MRNPAPRAQKLWTTHGVGHVLAAPRCQIIHVSHVRVSANPVWALVQRHIRWPDISSSAGLPGGHEVRPCTQLWPLRARPIRLAWFAVVFPALLLNYFGQGALLLINPAAASDPFFLSAPRWALWPLVSLSTLAAAVASQAVISGSYSLTRQAVQLGYLPRMFIRHTLGTGNRADLHPVRQLALCLCDRLVVGFGERPACGATGSP